MSRPVSQVLELAKPFLCSVGDPNGGTTRICYALSDAADAEVITGAEADDATDAVCGEIERMAPGHGFLNRALGLRDLYLRGPEYIAARDKWLDDLIVRLKELGG